MQLQKPYDDIRNHYVEPGESAHWEFEYEDDDGTMFQCEVSLDNVTEDQFLLNEGFIIGFAYETLTELKKEGLWAGEYSFDFEVPVNVNIFPIDM